jgi:hypothetical protein
MSDNPPSPPGVPPAEIPPPDAPVPVEEPPTGIPVPEGPEVPPVHVAA